MARMSIDDKFLRDPRVTQLAQHLGMSRWEAMGRLLAVFASCYDLERDTLTCAQIDIAADKEHFGDAMFEADLATTAARGMRIRGAAERIEYLHKKAEAGRRGGIKSGESRRNSAKQNRSTSEARGNPPDPVPDPVPAPDPVNLPDQKKEDRARRRTKPVGAGALSAVESESVTRILERLSEHTGRRYGSAEHARVIAARLREGITELELRAVVARQASKWKADENMREYLRPETLFGARTIHRYLEPARAEYADLIRDEQQRSTRQPSLALGSTRTPEGET